MLKGRQKQYFRQFIYAYLSLYHNDLRFMSGYKSYKDFKIKRTLDYLYLDANNDAFVILINIIAYLEVVLGICIVAYQFVMLSIRRIFTRTEIIECKKVLYGYGEKKIKELFEKSKIETNDVLIVESPFYSTPYYDDYQKTKLLNGLSFSNLFKAVVLSIKMIVYIKKKYGYRDFLFRAYSSFEYFLVCIFFDKLSKSNVIYFTNLADRWGYLFANLSQEVVFLQHGIMPAFEDCCFNIKIGNVDKAYYIDEEQRKICESVLFNNKPTAYYQDGMTFTSNDKLKNNNKKNILLVCNVLYWEREKAIIELFSNSEKWNLYVKPHPTDDPSNYMALNKECDFMILEKKDFPKVDNVISYDSTLATDYKNAGVAVLKYSDDKIEDKIKSML